ncbi:U4/U6 small nuclear ribonucleoprotein Prp3 [Acrodontium crateriforme]|uniref:U4/U6 small nuclear ribonucleoprotein Prp3 n=1 Tax=Acrodontium crateriforme TaxID=150365 RepID=A0AAQ3M3Q6_9PEZI|nr:U4/U6 small nuclear ribonucleoprotein Prp3 [Acrodontium crateriforme]
MNKRPLDSSENDTDSKRARSNNGSPAPAPATNGALEEKKAEAAARIAAVKAKLAASRAKNVKQNVAPQAAAPAGDVEIEARKAEFARKIQAMRARMDVSRNQGVSTSPVGGAEAAQPHLSEKDARMAEARARVAALARSRSAVQPNAAASPPRVHSGGTARGGLGIGLHPLLISDLSAPSSRGRGAQGPKFSTTKGNKQQQASRINPYFTPDDEDTRHDEEIYDPSLMARKGGDRKSKQLIFNQKGKFMAQANALRQQAKLEEMKQRIAAENRKTEIEEASDKAFLVPEPPEVEWWDEGLVDKIDTDDTIVTTLVQHPVILQAPQDRLQSAAKPLMLTKTEQKKLRRQRRMADMKEEQAKIRLGLIEPPPPKVKKSNMMRVLGEQAVKDPTAVEARVNREIAQRAADHAKSNADRQLTAEQRAEKLKQQQAGDEAKGVKVAVFRVKNLSSGKHRYQVDVNAKQNALTGMVILHPEMNLVIVEGGEHSIKAYKKLMLNRIKWAENTLPLSNSSGPSTFTGANDGTKVGPGGHENKAAKWLNPMDERGELKDLGDNECGLVWEGDEKQRSFKKWGSKACETDGEARDILSRNKMENMWTRARSMDWEK